MKLSFSSTKVGDLRNGTFDVYKKRGCLVTIFLNDEEGDSRDKKALEFIKNELSRLQPEDFSMFKSVISRAVHSFRILNMGIVSVFSDRVFAAVLGDASLKIVRNLTISNLLDGRDEILFLSGNSKPDDVFLFGTPEFLNLLNRGRFKELLEASDMRGLVVETEKTITEQPGLSMGGFVVRVGVPHGKSSGLNTYFQNIKLEQKFATIFSWHHESKVSASVATILIILLLTSVFFGRLKNKNTTQKNEEERVTNEIVSKLNEAREISGTDRQRAQDLINSAESILKEKPKKSGGGVDGLEEKIRQARTEILGIYQVKAEQYIDLKLLSDGFSGDLMISIGGDLYILDKKGKRVANIDTNLKRSEVVAGPESVKMAFGLIPTKTGLYLIGQEGIYTPAGKFVLNGSFSDDLKGIYYSGNFYLIDSSKPQILRYPLNGEVLGSPYEWLVKTDGVELAGTKSFVSDGYLWILDKDGQILKFSKGNKLNFRLSGIEKGGLNPDRIFTSEGLNSVYVLERSTGSIFVFEKDGKYRSRYIADKIREGIDIYVEENGKRIYFLTATGVYSFNLI